MCILPSLRNMSYNSRRNILNKKSNVVRTLANTQKKLGSININVSVRKTLEDYSREKSYYTKRLYSYCYSVDNIDEEASQNAKYILYKSRKM